MARYIQFQITGSNSNIHLKEAKCQTDEYEANQLICQSVGPFLNCSLNFPSNLNKLRSHTGSKINCTNVHIQLVVDIYFNADMQTYSLMAILVYIYILLAINVSWHISCIYRTYSSGKSSYILPVSLNRTRTAIN